MNMNVPSEESRKSHHGKAPEKQERKSRSNPKGQEKKLKQPSDRGATAGLVLETEDENGIPFGREPEE
ncbi:hypothetical protein [Streptomyces sp. NPDC089795]|uniref:hypothetical protein n=1 Tax=Streptomyces sp. NPDC089795 TaxID=3155297 RepID=UPI00343EE45D